MEVLTITPSEGTALACLPGEIQSWFREHFESPTVAQRQAWLVITRGDSLLLSAPTGTGKTLAAMMPILASLITEKSFSSSIRCLYLAPLKALVNDLQRTLEGHLHSIQTVVNDGQSMPTIATRTGDSTHSERQRLREDPPDILLTTPESLAVMLSHPEAADRFSDLSWVVVDEIHALAGNKRGADLSLSLERLQQHSFHELQRIGLSATSTPLTESAHFLVGTERPCKIAHVRESSPMELSLIPLHHEPGFLRRLVDQLAPELTNDPFRSILIFTNTRALSERLSWALRRRFPQWNDQIAVHHSALSAERRHEVEQLFKSGQLRVIVCSTSLELGIDIGSVDLVVLVHPPGGVVRLLQRVGRAGHAPGRLKRGLLFTATSAELLEAAVTGAAGLQGQFESLTVTKHPLDVLCQQLLGFASAQTWTADEAYALVKRAWPYHQLTRDDFDSCLAYLMGRSQLHDEDAWLPARLTENDDYYHILNESTARLLRRNYGTILAEATCDVLMEVSLSDEGESDVVSIGRVDELFADRLAPGDRFLLDGRCLEFRRLEQPRQGTPQMIVHEIVGRSWPPRWAGEGVPLSQELAQRLFILRGQAAEALLDGPDALRELLSNQYAVEGEALQALANYFEQQQCVSEIPSTNLLLIEVVSHVMGADYYLHTPLNRAGNEALSRVIARRLEANGRGSVSTLIADLGFALQVRDRRAGVTPEEFRQSMSINDFASELEQSVSNSFLLRSRFQSVALTGLMLLRNPLGSRRRVGGQDWGGRQLFEQVRAHDPQFVLMRQAIREVREEACDAQAALQFLAQVPSMTIRCRDLRTPSPFVDGWTQMQPNTEPPLTAEEVMQRLHAQLMGAEQ